MERKRFKITPIDFTNETAYEDPSVANACIVVVTKNGELGSHSHVSIETDTNAFADELVDVAGRGAQICLSGGWGKSHESNDLLTGLRQSMEDNGFVLTDSERNNDVMGNFGRRATVYPDRVVVKRTNWDYGSDHKDERVIYYPSA